MPPRVSGYFITLEGSEGCGKSTQAARLATHLRGLGLRVRELREPGGTPLGEEIRHTLKHSSAGARMTAEAELLLMNAARAQLVREVIRPALEAGEVVVCDRFFDSTFAYQGWGRGLEMGRVAEVVEFAVGPTRPQLTLLLQVPAGDRAQRLLGREGATGPVGDRFEAETAAFFDRVDEGFRELARREPGRIRVILAAGVVEEVQRECAAVVVAELAKAGILGER